MLRSNMPIYLFEDKGFRFSAHDASEEEISDCISTDDGEKDRKEIFSCTCNYSSEENERPTIFLCFCKPL